MQHMASDSYQIFGSSCRICLCVQSMQKFSAAIGNEANATMVSNVRTIRVMRYLQSISIEEDPGFLSRLYKERLQRRETRRASGEDAGQLFRVSSLDIGPASAREMRKDDAALAVRLELDVRSEERHTASSGGNQPALRSGRMGAADDAHFAAHGFDREHLIAIEASESARQPQVLSRHNDVHETSLLRAGQPELCGAPLIGHVDVRLQRRNAFTRELHRNQRVANWRASNIDNVDHNWSDGLEKQRDPFRIARVDGDRHAFASAVIRCGYDLPAPRLDVLEHERPIGTVSREHFAAGLRELLLRRRDCTAQR